MDQDTSLKTHRNYKNSSSFKVATIFAILLAIAVATLCGFIYYFYQQSEFPLENNFFIVFSVISIIALFLIAAAGYLISVFVVTRINSMADTASDIISTGDLSKRLSIDSRWDDLSFLSSILNEMLDKIETLMEGVQHITDTVAHDLRTPLARLRNKLERSEDIAAEELVKEVDDLLKTFNSLLSLSSLESGRQSTKFESFDLSKVVHDALAMYSPLAHQKEQTIVSDIEVVHCVGDKDLMFQVIANLLDNAIKFTPVAGSIQVALSKVNEKSQITILDSGPGIASESIDKIFDRFYRDQSQAKVAGSGLGLSLVQAVLKLHKADIAVENFSSGLKVTITI